jgi:two-component system, chemotaxis family, CheB/CheR fusion protein
VTNLEPAANESSLPSFPMVGIGASAGGLEAISALLEEIPAASGMAFLVVQHLAPSRPSLLPEILAKRTAMPVLEAVEDMAVEVDHLYIIPPNASMSIAQGRVRLRPRDDTLGPPMPIDDLLDSLAKDQGVNAIGVILSGSGSDGALGLQAVQHEGGITFAQDDATARFNSMPRAAIGLGCVDFVLSPKDIAQEIMRVGHHLHLASAHRELPDPLTDHAEEGLRPMFRLLRNACDIDFTNYKRGTIQRRLSRRMALQQLTSVADYIAVLESDAAETLALGRDLLIQVTEFFRDPETFDVLTQTVFPRLVGERKSDEPIRIWVPGCASGEEVYSIAICLMEYLGERATSTRVQIFGTDVSADALETARTGRYIENIARNVSPERLQRFFVRDGQYYRIDKSIRDVCTFARHNVATDPPFSRMDLVSCRNLLIYLNPVLQRSVMPLFHYALKANGVLMLGPSETVGAFSDLFGIIESKRSKLYSKKPHPGRTSAGHLTPTVVPQAPLHSQTSFESGPASTSAESIRREVDRAALARYVPPCVLCDDDLNIIEFRGDTSLFLVNPNGPPSSNLQRLARPEVFLAVSEAIKQVREEGTVVRKTKLRIDTIGGAGIASLEVHLLQVAEVKGRWFLIFFESPARQSDDFSAGKRESLKALVLQTLRKGGRKKGGMYSDNEEEIARLNTELDATRAQLRAMLEEHDSAREELKSSEEELLSSNEEFQSTNEELETAKEELQSLNEELSTTNDELRYRNQELRSVHDEVTRARDYADSIVETMSEPMLVLEPDLRITRANRAFYQVFETTPEKTLGTRLYALGNEQWNIPALRELLEELLPQRTVVRDFLITHEFPRIGLRTMRLNAVRVVWSEHALILLTIDDITRQHQAFGRLQTADRQKDEFLAMLAHELRTPLATIRNGLKIWERGSADKASEEIARVAAQRQLDHEIRLVEDLLDVSRITRGIITLKIEQIDLIETVRRTVEAMRSEIDLHQHELSLALPTDALTVNADAMRIEQVVTNLLGNALKYTPAGGQIRISLERDGDEAVLSVVDNGIGMAADLIPTIFEIFVQAERSLDGKSAGLGLGLALVSRLVELHSGTVRAFSEGLKHGSKFVVRLPALPRGAIPDVRVIGTGASLQNVEQRILVVDDNADSAESSASLLRLDGHEVQVARDGQTALRSVQDFHPDVVLLDIGLPGMDGYEVARQIRAMPDSGNILLIAHSGYGEAEHREKSRQAGFDHHLVKPADLSQLTELIASLRGKR